MANLPSDAELVNQPNPLSLPGDNVVTGISADNNLETKNEYYTETCKADDSGDHSELVSPPNNLQYSFETLFMSDEQNVVNVVNLKTQIQGTKDKIMLNLSGSFKDMILNYTVPVAVSGVIMAGLPYSGKSTIITEAIKKQVQLKISNSSLHVANHMEPTQQDKGLTMYELCVLGEKRLDQYTWSFTSGRSGITYATIACIIREMKHNFLSVDEVEFANCADSCTAFDTKECAPLNKHMEWIFNKAYRQFNQVKKESEKIELLSCGLSLINVFDVGVNKAVYDFLPYLAHSCKHLTRLVAFSMTTDAPDMFNPPKMNVEKYKERFDASLVMQWRSRMSYLLHFASLGLNSNTSLHGAEPQYRRDTSGKTIFFGTHEKREKDDHEVESEQTFSKDFQIVQDKILVQTHSKNMHWITKGKHWLEIKDTSQLERETEYIRNLIANSSECQKQMPLKWLFLRSMIASVRPKEDKIVIIKKILLRHYAHALNMDENAIKEFIEFFSSYGSIVPVKCSGKSDHGIHEYIIVNVFKFSELLSLIYYPKEDNTHRKYGMIANKDLKNKVIPNYPGDIKEFMEIVIQFGMAAEVHDPLDTDKIVKPGLHYYVPSARVEQPRKEDRDPDSAYIVIESANFPANVQASLAHAISNNVPAMHMVFTECSNVTTFQFEINERQILLELVYRGKQTELRILEFKDLTDDIKQHLGSTLKDVLSTCCDTLSNENQEFRQLLFNIGFKCSKMPSADEPEIHYYYSDENEDSNTCDCTGGEQCSDTPSQIEVWKSAIIQCTKFDRKGKRLNHEGKLDANDFFVIADELDKEKNLDSLVEKLGLKQKPEMKQEGRWRNVYSILMQWEKEQEEANNNPSKQKLIKIFESLGFKPLAMRLNS